MHTDKEPRVPNSSIGYETEDMSMSGVWGAAKWFFGLTLAMFAVAYGIYRLMNPTPFAKADEPSGAFARRMPSPPNPLLQTNKTARTDIVDLRRDELLKLTTPDWIDKGKGIVRIPIATAIDRYVDNPDAGQPSQSAGGIVTSPSSTPSPSPSMTPLPTVPPEANPNP